MNRQTISGERQWQKTSLIVSENKKCTVLLKSLGKARRQEGDEAVKHEYVSGGLSQPARTSDASPTLPSPDTCGALVLQTYAYFDL